MKSVKGVTLLLYFLCVFDQSVNAQSTVVEGQSTVVDAQSTALETTTAVLPSSTVAVVEDSEDTSNIDVPYCFNFTWLGPRYDNSSNYNTTCMECKSENPTDGVSCAEPFVITYQPVNSQSTVVEGQSTVVDAQSTALETTTAVLPSSTVAVVEDPEDTFNIDVPYCFNFTWLGPRYDNSSNYNTTCMEWKSENPTDGVPCAEPFVITYDGSEPNIDYLWANHRSQVVCRQANGDSCIKWSYYFNNAVQNVTRMCGRVYTESGNPVTSGCYSQRRNGYTISFCVCQSSPGGFKACNHGNNVSSFRISPIFMYALLLCYNALSNS